MNELCLKQLNPDLFDLCCYNFAHKDAAKAYQVANAAPKHNINLASSQSHGFCWIPSNTNWRLEVANRRLKISQTCPILYFVPIYRQTDGAILKSDCQQAHREMLNTPLKEYSKLVEELIKKLPEGFWVTEGDGIQASCF